MAQRIVYFRPLEAEILGDIDTLRYLGTRIITRWDRDSPDNLQEIYDLSALLFVRRYSSADKRTVAAAGTRNPSRYGIEMAESISKDFVRAGITVVNGLAPGIDATSHRADNCGCGCGIDACYPRENKFLMEEMIECGAVISESRHGIRSLATHFYRRNRIVSGLTKGTVVVEAAPKSVSLITGAHALDQNRDVFALLCSILNKKPRARTIC